MPCEAQSQHQASVMNISMSWLSHTRMVRVPGQRWGAWTAVPDVPPGALPDVHTGCWLVAHWLWHTG